MGGSRLWTLPAVVAALAVAGPSLAATGGPDAGGYTWADSAEPGIGTTPPGFAPTNLRPLGYTGDNTVLALPLPSSVFPTGFPFYGATYSSLWLSSNGWLSFVDPTGNSAPVPANVPNAAPPNATIAWLWDDWTLDHGLSFATAGATTAMDGYTITVRIARPSNPSQVAQVYVTLYRSGIIKLIYFGAVSSVLGPATVIGTENAAGMIGLPYMSGGIPGGNLADTYAVVYYPQGRLDCGTNVTAITCPQPPLASNNLAPSPSNVSSYNCSAGTYAGNEKVFRLDLTRTSNLDVLLNNTDGRNRAAFLMRPSCSEFTGCIAGGTTTVQARFLPPGTYYVLVDGVTAADNGNFTLEVQCTDSMTSLPCNSTLVAQSTTGPSALSAWSCAAGLTGPERVYEVNVTGPVTLRSRLLNPSSPNLRTLVSDAAGFSFQSPTCIAADPSAVTVWNAATGRYYVSVDGTSATAGSYDLAVECRRDLVCPATPRVIDVLNPVPVNGNTATSTNNVDAYYCASSAFGAAGERSGYTGPEDVYEFTLTAPSVVSFLFTAASPNMRVLFLRDCYEGSCLMEGACGENLQPGTYRLVVDGLNGASGAYSLTPLVFPTTPYTKWFDCPECVGACGQTPATISDTRWSFNSDNYCGTGCDFALFAVVECGTEMHFPLYDVETGHMRVFDVLRQQYLDVSVQNDSATCPFSDAGTRVEWEDQGCSMIPCPAANCGGGADCRSTNRTMDVEVEGNPILCGVFKIEFNNWGGFVWDVYANCTGDRTEQYSIYRDLCSALSNYDPLPEVGIENVTLDNAQCGSSTASGTMTVRNIGCLPVANYPVEIRQAPPAPPNPQTFTVTLAPGAQTTIPWTFPVTAVPMDLEFAVDQANTVLECSESAAGTVYCGSSTGLQRSFQARACPPSCQTAANAGPPTGVCQGASHVLDASGSTFACATGTTPEYRWENASGTPLPGCDWSTSPTCTVGPGQLQPGANTFRLRTHCLNAAPNCETTSTVSVTVTANTLPPRIDNSLRGVRRGIDAELRWGPISSAGVSGYRVYKDGAKDLPAASRGLVQQVGATVLQMTDPGAVLSPPSPVAYYQVVGLSCLGDLEGPY